MVVLAVPDAGPGAHPLDLSGRDAVVVDHAQAAELDVARIVETVKRESVAAVEPVQAGQAPLGRRPESNHGFPE
jgi:hypothetical protein